MEIFTAIGLRRIANLENLMFAVSPELFGLVSQAFVLGLILVTATMWSYDMGRTITLMGPVSALFWSTVKLLGVSLFCYCLARGHVTDEFMITSMMYGALNSVTFIIIGYVDDLNGSKLKWLFSSAN